MSPMVAYGARGVGIGETMLWVARIGRPAVVRWDGGVLTTPPHKPRVMLG